MVDNPRICFESNYIARDNKTYIFARRLRNGLCGTTLPNIREKLEIEKHLMFLQEDICALPLKLLQIRQLRILLTVIT